MAILGITSTETWDAYRDKNIRRSVQYEYPQGKAQLLGLLSIAEDEEATNDPQYSHWEHRYATPRTVTEAVGGAGPITDSAGSGTTDPFNIVAGTTYRCYVADASAFMVGNVVVITIDTTAADSRKVNGWVTEVNTSGADYITFKAVHALANVKNGSGDNIGKEVLFAGKAFAEGRSNVEGQRTVIPTEVYNYTQIHRTPIIFTGRELKTPVKFDESGTYTHRTREQALNHMIGIEQTILWGQRGKDFTAATVDPTTGAGLPTTFNGGLLWYLEQWEAGAYRTVTATADTDDDKRIIENTSGNMTEALYDTLLERVFRYNSNKSSEKLCLCGNKFLKVINQMYKSKSVLNTNIPSRDAYGMRVVEHLDTFGSLFYKTHPLFNENPTLINCALIIDVANIKYRPMKDRDTVLLKNRHERDFDGRKDEWFSDCGVEMWFPETCMFIKNVQQYTP